MAASKKTSATAKIRALLADDVSVKEIARRVKTTPNYVYYIKWRDKKDATKKTATKRAKVSRAREALKKFVDDVQNDTLAASETNGATYDGPELPASVVDVIHTSSTGGEIVRALRSQYVENLRGVVAQLTREIAQAEASQSN